MMTVEQLRVYDRAIYRIIVQGFLDERWSDWLEGMHVVAVKGDGAATQTVLEGELADQSALVGVLGVLQGLGHPVVSIDYLGHYPLSQAEAPPPTVYVDAAGVLYDATIPYDIRFFASLDCIVQYEPWLERDRIMIDQLCMIGIEKGKPFAPDAERTQLLNEAAAQGFAYLDGTYKEMVKGGPFVDGIRWSYPKPIAVHFQASQDQFANPNIYPVDIRGLAFTFFFTPRRIGQGQFYMMAIEDREGRLLGGGMTYKLNVPANAPVRQYWSATVYDLKTHALIREVSHAARSSQSPGLQVNADGSVDLYFGPKAPEGKESNWTPTDPNGQFEILFRLYGPLPALFGKTWVLPDLERIE